MWRAPVRDVVDDVVTTGTLCGGFGCAICMHLSLPHSMLLAAYTGSATQGLPPVPFQRNLSRDLSRVARATTHPSLNGGVAENKRGFKMRRPAPVQRGVHHTSIMPRVLCRRRDTDVDYLSRESTRGRDIRYTSPRLRIAVHTLSVKSGVRCRGDTACGTTYCPSNRFHTYRLMSNMRNT